MFDEIESVTEAEAFQIIGQYTTHEIELAEAAIELSVSPETFRRILNEHDIEVREPSKEDLVRNVADCFMAAEECAEYSFDGEDQSQVEEGVSAIIERMRVEPAAVNISEAEMRRQIRDMIWEAKTADGETGEVFWSQMGDSYAYFGKQERSQYEIVFPLNILYRDVERPNAYRVLNKTVEAVSDDEWEQYYEEALRKEQQRADESDAPNARNNLEHRFENAPNSLDRSGQTYWRITIDALDQRYAIDRCIRILRFLLGRINFALTRKKLEGGQMSSDVWNTRWMDLRHPFIYLVFEDGAYQSYSYSTDPTPRDPVKLFGRKAEKYETYLDLVPALNRDRSKMDDRLVKAIYSFQDAVTSTMREDTFLNHWRGAERLTLTTDTDSMSTVVKRALPVVLLSDMMSLSQARMKRNKLVHEGEEVEITVDDTNTVKEMLEGLIMLYAEKTPEWNHDAFFFFLNHGDKSDAALESRKQRCEREIELIEEIRESN